MPSADLRRLARPSGALAMVALDQRESMRTMFVNAGSESVGDDVLVDFKGECAKTLSRHASAVLVDQYFGSRVFEESTNWPAGCALVISADKLDQVPGEVVTDTTLDLDADPAKAVERGAVAMKFLVLWKDGQNADRCLELSHLFLERCRANGLIGILEAIVRPRDGETEFDREAAILDAARELGATHPDLYKAEVPIPRARERRRDHGACRADHCRRPDAVGRALERRRARGLRLRGRECMPRRRLRFPRRTGDLERHGRARRLRRASSRRLAPAARSALRDRRRACAPPARHRVVVPRTALLALDLGTTAIRAGAFAIDGELLAVDRCPTPTTNPSAGRYEHDADELWVATATMIRHVVDAGTRRVLAGCRRGGVGRRGRRAGRRQRRRPPAGDQLVRRSRLGRELRARGGRSAPTASTASRATHRTRTSRPASCSGCVRTSPRCSPAWRAGSRWATSSCAGCAGSRRRCRASRRAPSSSTSRHRTGRASSRTSSGSIAGSCRPSSRAASPSGA